MSRGARSRQSVILCIILHDGGVLWFGMVEGGSEWNLTKATKEENVI